jgi:hypothetical protein
MSAALCLRASGTRSFTLPLPHPYGFAMPVFIPVSSKNTVFAGGCRSAAASVFFKGVPKPFDDGVADCVAAAGKLQFLHNIGNCC